MRNLIALILGFLAAYLFLTLFVKDAHAETITVTYVIKTSKSSSSGSANLLPKKGEKKLTKTPATGRLTVSDRIRKVFGADADIAIAVAQAESGLRPEAVGDGHLTYYQDGILYGMSCGVFQIRSLPGRPTCDEMQDVDANIKYAYELFKRSGFNPWSAYTNQSYMAFMN